MKKLLFVFALLAFFTLSCNDNQRARAFGGTEEVKLKENEVLLNVTWKDVDMWILTRDTVTGVSYFREKSAWGMMEGAVIFK